MPAMTSRWPFTLPEAYARLFEPGDACHFAIAVEAVVTGKGIIVPNIATARQNHGDAGAGNAGLVVNDGAVPHRHARHVGDGVEWARRILANVNVEIAQSFSHDLIPFCG
jgi:hypothetical protein